MKGVRGVRYFEAGRSNPMMEEWADLSNLPEGCYLDGLLPDAAEAVVQEHQNYMARSSPPNQFDQALGNERVKAVARALSTLTQGQRDVVVAYCGIGQDVAEDTSFEAIGRKHGLTGQAVRVKYNNGISKLRNSEEVAKYLKDFLE